MRGLFNKSRTFRAEVTYDYIVDERPFTGNRISVGEIDRLVPYQAVKAPKLAISANWLAVHVRRSEWPVAFFPLTPELAGAIIEEKRERRVQFHADDLPVLHVNSVKNGTDQILTLLKVEPVMKIGQHSSNHRTLCQKVQRILGGEYGAFRSPAPYNSRSERGQFRKEPVQSVERRNPWAA
jgi:hypothetical protein